MEQDKVQRITELTKLSRLRTLTAEEQAERDALRREYINGFRANMECVLGNVMLREQDGTLHPLEKKRDPKPEA